MKLDRKKALASKVFNVGKDRVIFIESRLNEIKEAITKADIRSLKEEGAIKIKEKKGQKTKIKKRRKTPGNIRKNVQNKKREYVLITRKLRKYVEELKKKGLISKEEASDIRKKIRNRNFRSKAQLKEYIQNLRK